MRIPRVLLQEQKLARETALHVFCNASRNAYGACAYLRRAFIDDTVECSLIAGKGRVAPFKPQSICRLELMGALGAVRLTQTLVVTMKKKMPFWRDSTTVLHWIRQTSSNCKAFVGNRVSEILTIMSNLEVTQGAGAVSWRYVPAEANPADDIIQGPRTTELGTGFCYSSGPKFIYGSAELWPENKVKAPCENDERKEERTME